MINRKGGMCRTRKEEACSQTKLITKLSAETVETLTAKQNLQRSGDLQKC